MYLISKISIQFLRFLPVIVKVLELHHWTRDYQGLDSKWCCQGFQQIHFQVSRCFTYWMTAFCVLKRFLRRPCFHRWSKEQEECKFQITIDIVIETMIQGDTNSWICAHKCALDWNFFRKGWSPEIATPPICAQQWKSSALPIGKQVNYTASILIFSNLM
jgi:hypothetical protein